jgi:hypothetical protein
MYMFIKNLYIGVPHTRSWTARLEASLGEIATADRDVIDDIEGHERLAVAVIEAKSNLEVCILLYELIH